MSVNVHTADRWIRLILAALIGILYYRSVLTGITGGLLAVIAVIFFATAVTGHCPVYRMLGIYTKRPRNETERGTG